MPSNDELTPLEAAYIASNSYFALKDWAYGKPVAGAETPEVVQNRVLGPANVGKATPNLRNPTLQKTELGSGRLGSVLTAQTGFGTSSGFGYVLHYEKDALRHAIVAVRGTRPEMAGKPDVLTDFRASLTSFADYGLVHKGFKTTFDSAAGSLAAEDRAIMSADVVQCVGHSLGGAIATLIAAHYAARGKSVKLYTFGSPRVGALSTYAALQSRIGKQNIFRVAHDLDPISLVGTYPFIHVNPLATDINNMTLPSPTGSLFSMVNHDMNKYIAHVGDKDMTWGAVRLMSNRLDQDNSVLARWLLYDNNPGWVQYASAKTLGILFKLFHHELQAASTSVILGLSAIDMLAEILMNGLYQLKTLGERIFQLLRYAATWAGVTVAAGAEFTSKIIRVILSKMLATLRALAAQALANPAQFLRPLPLILAGSAALSACSVF
jgi:triacylglycerol lipase